MIQRIQSIYILLVAVLNGLLFILPLNTILIPSGVLRLTIFGLFNINEENHKLITELFPLLALTSITILIALISLFLFKKRRIQMRLSIYNSVLSLGLSFLSIYYVSQVANTNNTNIGFSVGLMLPLVSAIFSYLAFKAIKKDDELIRSVDRIR